VTDDDAPTLQGSLARGPTSRQQAIDEPMIPDDERYDLGKQIGRGGMGEVRLAHDIRIDREVAVKLMRPEQRDPDTIARFYREARIQGRLDHPAVAPVHDLGIDAQGNPYFVMKRLTGTTLAEVLEGRAKDPVIREKWPRRQLLAKFVDVCLAVEFAHTRGIVHRDLKPANIMLGDFGEVYVLDWGLARVIEDSRRSRPIVPLPGDSGGGHTAVGSVLGTPGYMPPEQIRNPSVDGRADVYALGCILYEILTGHAALPSGMEALDATLDAPCHRPSERFPELSIPELDEICARATAAERHARPTAREVGDAVQAYLDGDRDLARRRDLARHHARRAQEAFAITGDEARAKAMREAGRALVLDPNNVDAQGVLAHLLLEAPDQIPDIARTEADLERAVTRQAVMVWMWRGYAALVALMLGLFALPIRHIAPIIIGQLLIVATAVTVFVASRRPLPIKSPIFLLILWLNTGSLACGALIFGPLMIVPIYLVGSIAGGLSQPIGYRWPHVAIPHTLAFLVPLGLEWLGVLPSTYHLDHGLVLTPWAIDVEGPVAAILIVTSILSQVAIISVMLVMQRVSQDRAQDRLHAQTWHLQQLLPRRTTSRKRRPASDLGR
jgi:serine/threonine-protein kinase